MKIAVATDQGRVSGHFGHCEGFTIYELENNQLAKQGFVQNPGHKPGFLPVFLNDQKVEVIVSGGMGGGAVTLFNDMNIEVVVGAQGSVDEIAQAYVEGNLKSTGSVCHEHQHADSCH
jgi:predicted Fe-Mo cluster-binding NifX family protein